MKAKSMMLGYNENGMEEAVVILKLVFGGIIILFGLITMLFNLFIGSVIVLIPVISFIVKKVQGGKKWKE